VKQYNFTLYFLAYTEEEPPGHPDLRNVGMRLIILRRFNVGLETTKSHPPSENYIFPPICRYLLPFLCCDYIPQLSAPVIFYAGIFKTKIYIFLSLQKFLYYGNRKIDRKILDTVILQK
jgi:hypothetical protein